MTRIVLISFLINGLVSCHNTNQTPLKNYHSTKDSMRGNSNPRLKDLKFDNLKDPACGMPLTAGVEDTVHFKGKLYGFCSKECKDTFLKAPNAYLAETKKK